MAPFLAHPVCLRICECAYTDAVTPLASPSGVKRAADYTGRNALGFGLPLLLSFSAVHTAGNIRSTKSSETKKSETVPMHRQVRQSPSSRRQTSRFAGLYAIEIQPRIPLVMNAERLLIAAIVHYLPTHIMYDDVMRGRVLPFVDCNITEITVVLSVVRILSLRTPVVGPALES